jgi:hypothetical protein
MKALLKLLFILVVILGLVAVGLQIFLNRGLNPVVQKALPKVSETIGLDVDVEHVALNLFGGSLRVGQVAIGNPQTFEEPTVFSVDRTVLDVGLKSLLEGVLEISEATVKDAKLTVVRNQQGDLNLAKIQESLPKTEPGTAPAEPAEPSAPTAPSKPMEMPKVRVQHAAFNTQFEFVDHKTTNTTPNRIGLDLAMQVNDMVTFGTQAEEDWGTLSIKGALREKPNAFATDVNVRIAPLTNPQKSSFKADGKIVDIDMRELGNLAEEAGLTSPSADIALHLNVRDGVFLAGSELVATLREAELAGDLKKKHDNVKLPPDISLTIPVTGTLAKPTINIQQAISVSLLRNLARNPDYLLDNVTVDGKSLRDRISKALGGSEKEGEEPSEAEKTANDALKKLGDLFK